MARTDTKRKRTVSGADIDFRTKGDFSKNKSLRTRKVTNNKNTKNNTQNKGQASKTRKYKKVKTTNKKRKKKVKKGFLTLVILVVFLGFSFFVFSNIENTFKKNNIMTNSQFISTLEPIAVKEYKKTGLLPSVTISQAIVESNWGRSKLSIEANNLFGIKAGEGWYGDRVRFNTKEYYNSRINAYFRKYNSWEDSVKDRSNFLLTNKRYSKSKLFNKKTFEQQAQALEDAGYATTIDEKGNKIYADKLIAVIKSNRLYEIDEKVKNNN